MGKTANNERIKLRAGYHNNIAVGLYLGGFLIPYLAIFQKSPQIAAFIVSAIEDRKISVAAPDIAYVVAVLLAFAMAIALAGRRRKLADELMQRVTD
jgi:hypothetical protein